MKFSCLVCEDTNCEVLFESKHEKLARYGFLKEPPKEEAPSDLVQRVAFCEHCGFAWNTAFEYKKINYQSDQIIESGTFSKKYLDYQKSSAKYLKRIMGFRPDTVVEVGAGSGIFISAIEAAHKVAIEPSDEAKLIKDPSIKVYNEYFAEGRFDFPADLVVMRQVLEHIQNPVEFLLQLKNSFCHNSNFYFYLEVPNSTPTFREGRFYDFYYEHCNYFSVRTFQYLAKRLGMEVVDFATRMDGELISILLTTEKMTHKKISSQLTKNQTEVLSKIDTQLAHGRKIFAWGASGNGVQILNKLNIDQKKIEFVIDSDVNKQGKYIPGTFQKIIVPESAVEHNPDIVLILTQFHKEEIGASCKELLPAAEQWFVN